MKLKIKVTKEIIMKSSNCRFPVTETCAIALAVRDLFPKAMVAGNCIIVNGYDDYISLPKAAQEFIETFDFLDSRSREQLSPIEFEVDIPESVIDSIDINNLGETLELING
jgi:hypothetical protein